VQQFTSFPPAASIPRPRLAVFDPEESPVIAADTRETLAAGSKRKRKSKSKADRDFPLWFHGASGRWCRTINKVRHYFGTDKDAALAKWLDDKDDLIAGRTPRGKVGGLTIADLCNRFLTSKQMLVDSGELAVRTWGGYKAATDRIVNVFGKNRLVVDLASEDFEKLRKQVAKTNGLVGIANNVRLTRIVFKFAYDSGLIEAPVRFGPTFRVKQDKIRKATAAKPARMFEATELQTIIKACDDSMRAMVLLGINCGFGQNDLANLPQSAFDLDAGWVAFARPKTGVARRCALWPETVAALRKAIAQRPEPKTPEDADCVFLTHHRNRLVRASKKFGHIDAVALEFGKLLVELKLKRPGLQFYALRHTHRTIADATRDFPAIDTIMGHSDSSMGGRYRERIDDSRLKAVTDHVRAWLFPSKRKPR
jgi:integrase